MGKRNAVHIYKSRLSKIASQAHGQTDLTNGKSCKSTTIENFDVMTYIVTMGMRQNFVLFCFRSFEAIARILAGARWENTSQVIKGVLESN